MKTPTETIASAGVHYGYSRTKRHPSVVPYLSESKQRTDIISIEGSAPLIDNAVTFMKELGAQGKTVLFVGTKPEARAAVERVAASLHQPSVTERWIGGLLTNFTELKKRIAKLEEMKESRATGGHEKYTKKEQSLLNRELDRLNKYFGGLLGMSKLPDALVIVDYKKEHTAATEARKSGISVIGIGNTDCNLKEVRFPIVANDSTRSSIELLLDILKEGYEEGRAQK